MVAIDLNFIQPDTVTLTPNRRLAAFLLDHYQQQQLRSGCVVWAQPAVYPLVSWLNKLWQDSLGPPTAAPKRLLTAIEQQFIWEKIILTSKSGSVLLEVASTAKQAISAWELLLQWDLSWQSMVYQMDTSSDVAIFQSWATTYQQLCDSEGWLDFPTMVNILIKQIVAGKITLPKACYLIEHQELSPQYDRLCGALAGQGVLVVKQDLNHNPCTDIVVVPLATKDAEYQAVAQWAQQNFNNDPSLRLGIVVHDLEHCRDNIAAALAECFTEPVYNIAAPRVMAHYSLVDIACLILQHSYHSVITMPELSKLLQSPFIDGAETEMLQRADIATRLRNSNEIALEYSYIAKNLQKNAQFAAMFSTWLELLPTLSGNYSCEYWTQKIKAILAIWGWPGERTIDENERQLLVCWDLLLQTYQQLDFILQAHSFVAAYKAVQKLAFATPFLPETGKVSIHILGTLEAAGLPFDKLWIMGLHSGAWPAVSQPNPFMPTSIQRQFNLPRSSPARELAVAKKLTTTFSRGGYAQVIFSFPQMLDDIPTTASRLISQFKQITVTEPSLSLAPSTVIMEELSDAIGAEFVALTTTAPGGSKTLKLQASCPFWAFAEMRLKATPMSKATLGLTPAERGELLHGVLAKFWQQVKTHEDLLQTSAQELDALILSYVTAGLQVLQKKRPLTLTQNYITLEIERMVALIGKWLWHEKQRVPFVIYKVESQHLCRIGELDFKIRIDRIDQLTTGEIVIIDYKTGQVQIKAWFGSRLQDPQLPLYCLATELAPASIAFALIRPDLVTFRGIAEVAGLLPGVADFQALNNNDKAPTWATQRLSWQEGLAAMACEFQQGIATVQPLLGKVTCRYCALQAFCRVHEKIAAQA